MKRELEHPFLVIEGMSMAGKSTALAGIEEYLVGWKQVREPGGTEYGDAIRQVVQQTEFTRPVDPLASFLSYSASRAQLVSEVVMPFLESGGSLISDRWWYSSYAYQGAGEGVDKAFIRAVSMKVTRGLRPLVLMFDLAPELLLERKMRKLDLDRYDVKSLDFFAKVREGYKELGDNTDNWRVIDASKTPAEVIEQCLEILNEFGLIEV